MWTSSHKRATRQFSFWFWILLAYVVAALIWWFISLERQNREMSLLQLQQIHQQDPTYNQQVEQIQKQQKRNTTKYISEGITFLVLILIGAFFVYRALRKQIEYASLQRNFMMAVTHELKTPIATTRLSLETLLYRRLTDEQQKKLTQNAIAETNRLNRLTNNILLAAQIEEKNYRPAKEEVDLSHLAETVVEDYRRRFSERCIIASVENHITMQGDPLLLEIALSNLLDNAIKYTPKEKEVQLELCRKEGRIQCRVIDQGVGISRKEKQKIFEKFYRAGDEDTRKTKGTGLGLYLTKKIVEAHQGTIGILDHSPAGSIFIIQF
jgi:two-component system sensor histidine kinase CiaH